MVLGVPILKHFRVVCLLGNNKGVSMFYVFHIFFILLPHLLHFVDDSFSQ